MHRNVTILCHVDRTGYLGSQFYPPAQTLFCYQSQKQQEKRVRENSTNLSLFSSTVVSHSIKKARQRTAPFSSGHRVDSTLPSHWRKMTEYKNNSSPMTLDNSGFKVPHSLKANLQHQVIAMLVKFQCDPSVMFSLFHISPHAPKENPTCEDICMLHDLFFFSFLLVLNTICNFESNQLRDTERKGGQCPIMLLNRS